MNGVSGPLCASARPAWPSQRRSDAQAGLHVRTAARAARGLRGPGSLTAGRGAEQTIEGVCGFHAGKMNVPGACEAAGYGSGAVPPPDRPRGRCTLRTATPQAQGLLEAGVAVGYQLRHTWWKKGRNFRSWSPRCLFSFKPLLAQNQHIITQRQMDQPPMFLRSPTSTAPLHHHHPHLHLSHLVHPLSLRLPLHLHLPLPRPLRRLRRAHAATTSTACPTTPDDPWVLVLTASEAESEPDWSKDETEMPTVVLEEAPRAGRFATVSGAGGARARRALRASSSTSALDFEALLQRPGGTRRLSAQVTVPGRLVKVAFPSAPVAIDFRVAAGCFDGSEGGEEGGAEWLEFPLVPPRAPLND